MPVNNPFALTAGIQYTDGTASTATSFTGTVAMSFNAANLIVGLRSDASDNLLVTGTLTHNNAAPIANNFGVLPAVASSAAPTYTAGDQVLLSTDLAGNLRVNATFTGTATNNITQWNSVNLGSPSAYGTSPGAVNVIGVNAFVTNTVAQNQTQLNSVALGSPSNYGTSPGAVSVQGVNAFVTNTVAVTLTSTTITGTVAVTQSTSPWVVGGGLTNNNAAPAATNLGVLPAIAETAYGTVTYTTGNQVLPVTDLHGALNQDLQAYAGTQLTGTVTAYGTAPTGNVFGVNAFITNTVPVTLTSTTITGTVAVTQSTSPWVVSLTSTTVTNTVAENLTQVAGTTLGATAVTNFGTAPAAAAVPGVNASIFAGTTGITATGSSINANITNTVAVTLTSTTITGTVAVTQSTSPWVIAGNKTNNNAAPGATNEGVLPAIANAATQTWTEGNLVLESVDLSGRQRVRGTLTHNNTAPAADQLSVIPALANAATPTFTEGDQVLLSTDLSGNIRAIEKKDTGRTYITWFIDAIAGVTAEALVSLQVNKGGTLQTAGTTYTVTAGKTLRLQSISCSVQETNGTVQWLKLRVRSAAAVTASSPVIAGLLVATDAGNTNNAGYGDQSFPDGLEIAAGQQVGISQVTGSTSTNVTVTLVGYEY